jgi:orotate phosphoribosyltransferase
MVMGGDFLACSSRKEEKDHGDTGIGLLGSPAGKQVILVDDVMSTGDSAAEALTFIERQQGTVVGAVIAFDRQERAKEGSLSATRDFHRRYKLPVAAAATLDDLIVYLREEGGYEEVLEAIYQYRRQYGVLPPE